jgi:hypothetical protein
MKLESYKPSRNFSTEDRMIQVVLRTILEKIYHPKFKESCHGFRSMRNCHTALLRVKKDFIGVKWWIKKEITFHEVSHPILLNILRKHISDERFIRLVAKFLKAGMMEKSPIYETYGGQAPIGILPPILLNIYLHELDKFFDHMENVTYVRYGGDVLVGVEGSKRVAEYTNKWMNTYLREERSIDQSEAKVMHHSQKIYFLGYEIASRMNNIHFFVPYSKLKDFLIKNGYGKMTPEGKWKAVHRSFLLNRDPIEIIKRCNIEFRAFYHYYKLAMDVRKKLTKIHWIWTQSVAKTLAGKYKTKVNKLTKIETELNGKKIRKFYQGGRWGVAYVNGKEEVDFYPLVSKDEIHFHKEPIDRNLTINQIPYTYKH